MLQIDTILWPLCARGHVWEKKGENEGGERRGEKEGEERERGRGKEILN